jgi:aarF domain-containing kinase
MSLFARSSLLARAAPLARSSVIRSVHQSACHRPLTQRVPAISSAPHALPLSARLRVEPPLPPSPAHPRHRTLQSLAATPSQGSSERRRWAWLLVPVGAAGLIAISSQTLQADAGERDTSHDDPKEPFAPSIEAIEAEPPRNPILRFFSSIGNFLHIYIVEPLGTGKRFLVLVSLFLPVLLTLPMVWVGRRREKGKGRKGRRVRKDEEGQRWGALWWYGFLVRQMERAGPTFIKVSGSTASACIEALLTLAPA